MRLLASAALLGLATLAAVPAHADTTTETIVMIRHGEKPAKGLGQLSCKGLNRSLAIPSMFVAKYGKPDFIFASNPSHQKADKGIKYDYVRPLATVEPLAIRLGMPVNTQIGQEETQKLEDALLDPSLAGKTVMISWEHTELANVARKIITDLGGTAETVPVWGDHAYDTIYIVKITRDGDKKTAQFSTDQEGLDNGLSDTCPGA
jgi:hypothetical protein